MCRACIGGQEDSEEPACVTHADAFASPPANLNHTIHADFNSIIFHPSLDSAFLPFNPSPFNFGSSISFLSHSVSPRLPTPTTPSPHRPIAPPYLYSLSLTIPLHSSFLKTLLHLLCDYITLSAAWFDHLHFDPVWTPSTSTTSILPITTPSQPSALRSRPRRDKTPYAAPTPMAQTTPLPTSRMTSMDLRVGGKYRIGKKIGSGSFGALYLPSPTFSPKSVWSAWVCVLTRQVTSTSVST